MTSPQRVVLITGASTGIGRATAELLVRQGFRVFAGMRHPTADAALPGAETVQLDVTRPDDVAAAVEKLRAACPAGLYGLVNNAGMAAPNPTELADLDELRQLMEVNAIGPLRVIQACLPLLRPARGRIVNITSMNGVLSLPIVGAYSASKFALEALSDALRVELRPWGVSVSVIRPGQVRTPIFDKALAALDKRSKEVPPELAPGYNKLYERATMFSQYGARAGNPPEAVARVVLKALEARWPRPCYTVGLDVRGLSLLQALLPARIYSRVLARIMGTFDPVKPTPSAESEAP